MKYKESTTSRKIVQMLKPKVDPVNKVRLYMNYPSKLVMCPRKVCMQEEQEQSDQLAENLARGYAIHTSLQRNNLLGELPLEFEGVSGKVDLITSSEGDITVPVEIYTTAMSQPYSPEAYPIKTSQLLAYIYMMRMNTHIVDRGEIIIYYIYRRKLDANEPDREEKAKRRMHSWTIYPTQEDLVRNWLKIRENRAWLRRYTETEELPPKVPTITPVFHECEKCDFRKYCWGNEELQKKFVEALV